MSFTSPIGGGSANFSSPELASQTMGQEEFLKAACRST